MISSAGGPIGAEILFDYLVDLEHGLLVEVFLTISAPHPITSQLKANNL